CRRQDNLLVPGPPQASLDTLRPPRPKWLSLPSLPPPFATQITDLNGLWAKKRTPGREWRGRYTRVWELSSHVQRVCPWFQALCFLTLANSTAGHATRGGGKLRAPPSCSNSFSRHPLRNQLLWTLSKLTGWWGLSTSRSVLPSP